MRPFQLVEEERHGPRNPEKGGRSPFWQRTRLRGEQADGASSVLKRPGAGKEGEMAENNS